MDGRIPPGCLRTGS